MFSGVTPFGKYPIHGFFATRVKKVHYDVPKPCPKFGSDSLFLSYVDFEDRVGFGGFLGFSVPKFSHLGFRTFRTGTGRFRADDAYVRKHDDIS